MGIGVLVHGALMHGWCRAPTRVPACIVYVCIRGGSVRLWRCLCVCMRMYVCRGVYVCAQGCVCMCAGVCVCRGASGRMRPIVRERGLERYNCSHKSTRTHTHTHTSPSLTHSLPPTRPPCPPSSCLPRFLSLSFARARSLSICLSVCAASKKVALAGMVVTTQGLPTGALVAAQSQLEVSCPYVFVHYMPLCIYVCTHTHTYTHVHTYARMYTHTHTHTRTHTSIRTHTYGIYTRTYVRTKYTHVHTYAQKGYI